MGEVLERVGEGREQADLVEDRVAGGVVLHGAIGVQGIAVDVLVQHRVAEAVDGVRELGHHRWVEMHVIATEHVDVGRDLPRELAEHEMLVLGFIAETRRLEDALAVPFRRCDLVRSAVGVLGEIGAGQHPLRGIGGVALVELGLDLRLALLGQPVVLRMEHVLHCSEADVLVDAAIAGHIVLAEQRGVEATGWKRQAGLCAERIGLRVHIVDERGAGADVLSQVSVLGVLDDVRGHSDVVDNETGCCVTLDRALHGRSHARRLVGDEHLVDDLRKSVGSENDVAVGVGLHERHARHVVVG